MLALPSPLGICVFASVISPPFLCYYPPRPPLILRLFPAMLYSPFPCSDSTQGIGIYPHPPTFTNPYRRRMFAPASISEPTHTSSMSKIPKIPTQSIYP